MQVSIPSLNTTNVIIIIVVIVVLLLLYIASVRGWFKPAPRKLKLVEGGGAVVYSGSNIDKAYYKRISDNLYDSLSVNNYTDTAMTSAEAVFLNLTDNELRLVSNEYEKAYRAKKENTIKNLVNGEWVLCSFVYNSPACSSRDYINQRLNQIGV